MHRLLLMKWNISVIFLKNSLSSLGRKLVDMVRHWLFWQFYCGEIIKFFFSGLLRKCFVFFWWSWTFLLFFWKFNLVPSVVNSWTWYVTGIFDSFTMARSSNLFISGLLRSCIVFFWWSGTVLLFFWKIHLVSSVVNSWTWYVTGFFDSEIIKFFFQDYYEVASSSPDEAEHFYYFFEKFTLFPRS
jgi:hypothetical protein